MSQALLVRLLALATIEGQFVDPIILGRRMALSPMVIVIALMIGAWGVGGGGIAHCGARAGHVQDLLLAQRAPCALLENC